MQPQVNNKSLLAWSFRGPWLIAFAALLWAADSIFRSKLVGTYTPVEIVFVSHLICLPFALYMVGTKARHLRLLSYKAIMALLVISGGGSVGALVLFTEAFATTSNYTVPILIQKLQPLFAITLAAIFLKERLTKRFWIYAAIAISGAYLVSFGSTPVLSVSFQNELHSILLAIGAAAIWGACTVAGRSLVRDHPFLFVTGLRYILGFVILSIWAISTFGGNLTTDRLAPNFATFTLMALIPGIGALVIYYFGLSSTKASIATISELSFPIGAMLINWIFLDQSLEFIQIAGALMLIASITALSLDRAPRHP